MARMSSVDAIARVLADYGPTLLHLAGKSIAHGLASGRPLEISPAHFPDPLRRPVASFITLHLNGKLRGCTGSPMACRPLAADVAVNAFTSAFRDPRFDPLVAEEAARIETEVSLLTDPEPMEFSSQDDLIAKLVPGRDGLILVAGQKRGLFLPQVWDSVADARDFLDHLKVKAGLARNFWSDDVRIDRFLALKTSTAAA